MNTKRLDEIKAELLDADELIDETPFRERKTLYNLAEKKRRLIMERDDLLCNNKNDKRPIIIKTKKVKGI